MKLNLRLIAIRLLMASFSLYFGIAGYGISHSLWDVFLTVAFLWAFFWTGEMHERLSNEAREKKNGS